MRKDPVGLDGGVNPYRYVGENPINHSDFWGLMEDSSCLQKDCRKDAALKLIQFAEFGSVSDNNYTTLFGGSTFFDTSTHPNIKITIGKYTSTSAGAYQINNPAWQAYTKETGSHDFSPSSQDAYALWRINDAGAMDDVDAGNVSGMIDDLNGIWVSLPGGSQQRKGLTKELATEMFNTFYNNCMAGR